MNNTKVISFIGRSGSGKTTLVTALISLFCKKGLAVHAVKHAGKNVELDRKGKDSYSFYEAGAQGITLYCEDKLFIRKRIEPPVSVQEILSTIDLSVGNDAAHKHIDLVLVEGFKHSPLPSVVVIDRPEELESINLYDNVVAVVTDLPLVDTCVKSRSLPLFKRDEIEKISRFILNHKQLNFSDWL